MASNELLTDSIIAKEALMIVENNLTLTRKINRRYESKFAREGNKIGDSLGIRLPVRWEGREGEKMEPEGAQERNVQLKIDRVIGQDLAFSNVDLTLKIDMFKERYLDTACAAIANKIDRAMAAQYINVPNFSGAPGTIPADLDPYFDASVGLSDYGVPTGKRNIVLTPRMQATIVSALKGLFNAAKAVSDQYETGGMGHVIGFDWDMDQNLVAHTVGALGGTPLVNTASQTGTTLVTDGWTASVTRALRQGDVITAASINGLNPQSRDDNGTLRGQVVTADCDSDSGGNMTIPIFPGISTAGPYRNSTDSPANDAVIKIFGSASAHANKVTRQGLAFHKEWLTAAFVDLELPKGMEMAARAKSEKLGISIRIVKGYDIRTNEHLCRLDVCFGIKQTYEDFCWRIVS